MLRPILSQSEIDADPEIAADFAAMHDDHLPDNVEAHRDAMARALLGTTIDGWRFDVDRGAGSFYWQRPGADLALYATPWWEDAAGVALQLIDDTGTEPPYDGALVPFVSTNDVAQDVAAYRALMREALTGRCEGCDDATAPVLLFEGTTRDGARERVRYCMECDATVRGWLRAGTPDHFVALSDALPFDTK